MQFGKHYLFQYFQGESHHSFFPQGPLTGTLTQISLQSWDKQNQLQLLPSTDEQVPFMTTGSLDGPPQKIPPSLLHGTCSILQAPLALSLHPLSEAASITPNFLLTEAELALARRRQSRGRVLEPLECRCKKC